MKDRYSQTPQKGPRTEDSEQEIAKFQQVEWTRTELEGSSKKLRTTKTRSKELKYISVNMRAMVTEKVPGAI
eukprot:9595154-Heterocapsa_arctica.AAC.1